MCLVIVAQITILLYVVTLIIHNRHIELRGHFGHGAISATITFVLFWMCYYHLNTPNTHTGKFYCTL